MQSHNQKVIEHLHRTITSYGKPPELFFVCPKCHTFDNTPALSSPRPHGLNLRHSGKPTTKVEGDVAKVVCLKCETQHGASGCV